ncbi:MAG: L,D-transpeptidase [Actinobacteria bacterium]|nr:L,D-transpeptidase [Actinomycetota bacterium]
MILSLTVAVTVVGLAGSLGAAAAVYDEHSSGRLLPGTTIEGIPVGDMPAGDAIRVLRDKLEAPLHRPLTVQSGDVGVATSPWELGLRVDVRAAVLRAEGRVGGSLLTRVWRRLFTHPVRVVSAAPRWQTGQLDGVLQQVADQVRKLPTEGEIDSSTGFLTFSRPKAGTELDLDLSRQAVRDAIDLGDPVAYLATKEVPPATSDVVRQAILVRTGENKLYLYQNGVIVKSWPVATGASGYDTPTGQWKVVEKVVDPVWYNPGSAWARGMPATIGPGPSNPLGTRALALDAPAILIHGTPDRSSIGYSVSHGCIRMLAENEQELFDQVDVGTPVVIVHAAAAQARTATPTPTDSAQAAAVLF